ncbi:MAG: gamma-glutamyl-gamma-aminobutyrate hydrolase family protein [Candidatus Eremiobacteraeota bacterium]|nr:gamma-glutamyl-gamma-aminobutyrate hydrolase family protein [Candidatus Eremiobacteraeota bacterium]
MPLIGITCGEKDLKSKVNAYREAIEISGGEVFLFHPSRDENEMKSARDKLSGILFMGGYDVDPSCFNEPPHEKIGIVEKERDTIEIEMAKWAWRKNMPVLGICRGIQVFNIALGGDIYQDIQSQVKGQSGLINHVQRERKLEPVHTIFIKPGSILSRYLGNSVYVNSTHHQAVRKIAPGLSECAWAQDGIIEGLEAPGKSFVLLVQFHPELLWKKYPVFLSLFYDFVKSANDYELKRGTVDA